MTLLYVHSHLNNRGIATVVMQRMNYLVGHTDFEVHYFSEKENDPKKTQLLDPKIHLHGGDFDSTRLQQSGFLGSGHFKARRLVKKKLKALLATLSPDFIINLESSIGCRSEVIPFLRTSAVKIIEFHHCYRPKKSNHKPLLKRIKKRWHPYKLAFGRSENLHNKYDFAVTLTKEDQAARSYLKIGTGQIYNPVPIPKETPSFHKRRSLILGVGSLDTVKNFEDLITAVSHIKNKIEGWKIYICGTGPQRTRLREKIKSLGLEKTVFLKGYVYPMDPLYNRSKLLISTSRREGLPMNILEAFAHGIPVISYNYKNGPKEIIKDGQNGYLIPSDPNELAKKISILTQNEKLLRSFSKNTQEDIYKFKITTVMGQWIRLYKHLAATSPT